MNDTSRRGFMAAAGATAAAGTVALSAGGASAATATGDPAREAVVAWVPDHRSDKLHLMVAEREIVVRDRALVRQILAAAGGK